MLPTQTCLQLLSSPPTPTQPTLAPREFLTLSGRWVFSSRPSVSNGFRACLRGRGKIPDFTLYRQRYCFAHKTKCAHKNISLGQGQRKRQDSSKPPGFDIEESSVSTTPGALANSRLDDRPLSPSLGRLVVWYCVDILYYPCGRGSI